MWPALFVNVGLSVAAYFLSSNIIPKFRDMFIKANLFGIDLNKTEKRQIPEATGVITSCIFLNVMFLFIPFAFGKHLIPHHSTQEFPHEEFVEFVAALLSICCMVLLGFADDVLNLRWKHKLLLPTMASLPLLMVYYVNFNSTTIIIPKPVRFILGNDLNLGFIYYIYMGMLAVFCTNAINIYAGVNGLEAGQSVVIAASIILFNILELFGECWHSHLFSLYFMIPYLATSLALLRYNWYPARAFVGDTYCYFSGMTMAVVAILGHFSKTSLLFFMPQILNFLFSIPQLFHFLPCPRHRLPRLDKETGLLEPSVFQYQEDNLNALGRLFLKIYQLLGLVRVIESQKDGKPVKECTNCTVINLALNWLGPTHEEKLTVTLLSVQVICSGLAFVIRYPLASQFY
nr:EOG090X07N9 [Sida crystallina]